MLIVGVTGRSGSGKTLVARHCAALGYPMADGDEISRRVTGPGSPGLAKLAAAFGPQILDANGSLLRRKLGMLAFASPEKTALLMQITHPFIMAEFLRLAQQAKEEGAKLFFLDGAAIVGSAFQRECDKLVVVTCSRKLAISRIILRDGISKTAAAQRLAAQIPEKVLLAAADYIIENNRDEAALHHKTEVVVQKLLAVKAAWPQGE